MPEDNVRYLPSRHDDAIEAELVTPAMERERRERARRDIIRGDIAAAVGVTRAVVTHPVTRGAARNVAYVVGGVGVITREWWMSRTRASRTARAKELAGDEEGHRYWHEAAERATESRFNRWMTRIELARRLMKAAGIGFLVLFALLIALGLVLWWTDATSNPFLPVVLVAYAVSGTVVFLAAIWVLFPAIAGVVLLRMLWRAGRRGDTAPAWCAAEPTVTRDDTITPSRVVLAFRELGIAPLRKAIVDMGDGGAALITSPGIVIAGCGVEFDVTLPPAGGVSTADILARRRKLAEQLDRHEHEVHLAVAPRPRTVRVWAADSGALDEPIGPSPLVYDESATASYKHGRAPWGMDLRGDPVTISLYQRHVLVVGSSNQGKALALDTLVPTPTGWTTMGELQTGDQVFGLDGNSYTVTDTHDVQYGRPCFAVEFSDGTSIVADADHLWFTETAASRRSVAANARRPARTHPGKAQQWRREIAGIKTTAEIAGTVRAVSPGREESNHSIPVANPIRLPEAALPLDPYILGYWLGDGTGREACITCGDQDLDHLVKQLETAGLHVRVRWSKTAWSVYFSTHPPETAGRGRSAANVLRQLGVINNKHVPAVYMRASIGQRFALLAGLLDSDGYINPREGLVEFAVCDQRLADDAAELIQSLGFKIRRTIKRVKGRNPSRSTSYKITFRPREQVFRLPRKAEHVWIGRSDLKSGRRYVTSVRSVPSVPVRCITVNSPDSLYLVSQAFIATHNTWSMRSLALWLALDPKVELWIGDLKGVGDWSMFEGIASRLIEGPSDEHVIAVTEMVEDAVTEMERRMADRGNYRPLIVWVDEIQVGYMCPEKDDAGRPYGGARNTSRLLTAIRKVQNQGRAVDVLFGSGAQNPTAQNLPVLAREGAHLRICTSVGTVEQSGMALGDKAVNGGAAPHLLRAGLDKGTVVVAGDGAPLADGQASVTVRVHPVNDDEAWGIAERAKALRGPVVPYDPDEVRDLLDDVHEAMRDDVKVRAADMPARLRELAPGHRPYRNLNGERLAERLRELGCEVKGDKGYLMVRIERVLAARDMRDRNEGG